MKKIGWIFLVWLMVFASCTQYKQFTDLQPSQSEKDTIYKPNLTLYRLQPADILYINVLSIDKNVTELFNAGGTGTNAQSLGMSGGGGMYFMGYSIDKNGFIHLPVIGDVYVAGSTVGEASLKIQKLADLYIKDARIELKLVSFKITLMGEIGHPGQITIFNDRANILEAIALGGDITYNGNRKKILIIRDTKDGGMKTINVDLTKRNLLKSDQFYIQPNDIIYVEPLRTTVFRLRLSDYTMFLSVFTTAVTTFFLINQLTK